MREAVYVYDTVAETVKVFDTLRETTTIQLNAEGDTVRKETEREHVSDRTRERASASQQTATSQQSRDEERTNDERQTTEEQPKAKSRWGAFWWGFGAAHGLLGLIGLLRLIRK